MKSAHGAAAFVSSAAAAAAAGGPRRGALGVVVRGRAAPRRPGTGPTPALPAGGPGSPRGPGPGGGGRGRARGGAPGPGTGLGLCPRGPALHGRPGAPAALPPAAVAVRGPGAVRPGRCGPGGRGGLRHRASPSGPRMAPARGSERRGGPGPGGRGGASLLPGVQRPWKQQVLSWVP